VSELKELVSQIADFHSWGHPEKIRFFGWYLHTNKKKDRFTAANIRGCYAELPENPPSNVNPYLAAMVNRNPKEALKDNRGYHLVHKVRQELDKQYGQRQITVQVTNLLKDLPSRVPSLVEKDFLDEALTCYANGAFRAAIVMTWNLAYSHFLDFLVKHHLPAFNARYPVVLQKKWDKAKVQVIAKYEDFSVDLKESEVLTVAKSANAIDNDVYKVLDQKLDRRNSAAHPSSVKIGQLQAEEYIDDLVTNVVLKLII
jgi:hypothetical protein